LKNIKKFDYNASNLGPEVALWPDDNLVISYSSGGGLWPEEEDMSKPRDTHKEKKKKPQRTAKEKKQAKLEKKKNRYQQLPI